MKSTHPSRQRRTWGNDARTSRRGRWARWRIGAAVAAAFSLVAVGAVAAPAYATSYPSWSDVQKAKASQAAAAQEVSRINSLIAQLNDEVTQTQAAAVARGKELADAQAKFDAADRRATDLQTQADASAKKAKTATTEAGRFAAQLYQAGGDNLTLSLLLSANKNGKHTDRLLATLGSMSRLVERSSEIYAQAVTAQNTAESLSSQAKVAKAQREALRIKAEAALKAAALAAQTAQDKLAEQQTHIVDLNAQLAALKNKTAKTVAGYQKGVAVARAAAAKAAAARRAGYVGAQGWAVPVRGWITAGFGPRVAPCADCSTFHEGVDLATSCGTPIHAAHSGTVLYAGWFEGYGNYIRLNNGGGIWTAYGHIGTGNTYVRIGQHVSAGQVIARVGDTGHSTGCHLHFEVRINSGTAINPIPFMRAHGAPLG